MFLKIFLENQQIENPLKFSEIKIDGYTFISNLIYVKGDIVGVMMPFVIGTQVSKYRLDKIDYDNLLLAFSRLEASTKQLSNQGIQVYDTSTTNILFNDQIHDVKNNLYGFNMIDTAEYSYVDMDNFMLYKHNLSLIVLNIFDDLFKNLRKKDINELKNFKKDLELLSNPVSFLTLLKEELSKKCDKNIESIYDAVKIIRKIK